MSHFSVLVITEDEPTEDVLTRVLAPFGETEDKEWWKWDWWELGGRWLGTLVPKPGAKTFSGKPGVKVHEGGVDAQARPRPEADGAVHRLRRHQGRGSGMSATTWAGSTASWREKLETEWQATFDRLLAETPDDHWLSIVDCHIY